MFNKQFLPWVQNIVNKYLGTTPCQVFFRSESFHITDPAHCIVQFIIHIVQFEDKPNKPSEFSR